MPGSAEHCAAELLETIPLIMRAVRSHMRRHRTPELSVPAFRTLMFLHHHPESSLSDAADFIGLTLPSMSKLVDGLVTRELLLRQEDLVDRRRVTLALTPAGKALTHRTRLAAQACLAEVLAQRTDAERGAIAAGLAILKPAFTPLLKSANGYSGKKVLR